MQLNKQLSEEEQVQEKLQNCLDTELRRHSTVDGANDDMLLREPTQGESLEGPAILDAVDASPSSASTHNTREGAAKNSHGIEAQV